MDITSIKYFIFIFVVLLIYTISTSKCRWIVLLLASYFFYASFNAPYLLVTLIAVTVGSYLFGRIINETENLFLRKICFYSGIIWNLSFLVGLKYLPFINENIRYLSNSFGANFDFYSGIGLVTIGVSYFTFQSISYLIDTYLGVLTPEKHLGFFALSIAFFPKLLQGPIERGGNILPQIHLLTNIQRSNLNIGFHLFLWGLFKKVVIANRLAAFVDPVYSNLSSYHGLSLILATYLFAFQLYFDFSGYTDMARGAARCFNIKLAKNFNSPYLAKSSADFWRRWHMSFSSWILDYIFKPIQFRLRYWFKWGTPIALFVTFTLSGLWHGAAWHYIVWGLIHGLYLSTGIYFQKQLIAFYKKIGVKKGRLLTYWNIFLTFHMICFAWIFFRAKTLSDAFYIVKNSIIGLPQSILSLLENTSVLNSNSQILGQPFSTFWGSLVLTALVCYLPNWLGNRKNTPPDDNEISWFIDMPYLWKGISYGTILYLLVFCGTGTQSFIYMQF